MIESITGRISLLSPLDYESSINFDLVVACSDMGTPSRLNRSLGPKVNVLDVNDHALVFSLDRFATYLSKIYLNESTELGAFDLVPTPKFHQIRYSLDSM